MAQVKKQILKAHEGETAPAPSTPKKKYGSFHRGTSVLSGEDAYNKLYDLDTVQGGFGATSFARSQVEAGNDVFITPDGSLYAIGADGTRIDFDEKKLRKSNWAKDWGATFNSKNHQERVNLDALRKFTWETPKPEEPKKKDVRFGDNNWFTYDESTGEDGKKSYTLQTGTNYMFNDDLLQRIEEAHQYFTGNREEMDKIWNMNWSNADEVRNYADEWSKEGFHESLLNAIRTNTFNNDQLKFLKLLGYSKDGVTPTQPAGGEFDPKQKYTDSATLLGTKNAPTLESMGITVTRGDDGKLHVVGKYGDQDLSKGTWLLGGDYNWFGDKYRWLHNGILYEEDAVDDDVNNPSLFNATKKWLSYNGKTSQDWWDYHRYDNAGVHFSGENDENPFVDYNNDNYFDTEHNGAINTYLADKGPIAINEFTGNFDNVAEGTRIYGYVNPASRTAYGTMGDIKYFSIDKNGNIADWNQAASKRPRASAGITQGWSTREEENNNNFVYHRFNLGQDGTENTILTSHTTDDPNRRWFLKTGKNNFELDPSKISSLMEAIKNGDITRNDQLKQYYKVKEGLFTGNQFWNMPEYKGYTKTTENGIVIYTDADGKKYRPGAYGGLVEIKAEGGKINWDRLQKLQYGGGINGSKGILVANNKAEHNIDRAHNMDKSDGGLTQAERLQLTGAIGDLIGVGTSFVPGAGNIAGAGIGAAASTARFAGDIALDGFQGKDLLSYIGNLALDATSLVIPAIGKSTKGIKALKTIKNISQPLMVAAGAMGLTETVGVLGKVINGEKLTSKDTTNLIQGLSKIALGTNAVIGIGKEAKTAVKTIGAQNTTALSKQFTVNGKTATAEEISSIIKANKTEDAAMKAIAEKFGISNVTADQIASLKKSLGIDSVKKWKLDLRKNPTKKAEFNDGTVDNKSTLGYMLNSRARNKALDAIAGKLTPEQLAAANAAVKNQTYTEDMPKYLAQTYARLGAERPYAFQKGTFAENTGVEKLRRFTFGGSRFLREPVVPQQELLALPAPRKVYETPVIQERYLLPERFKRPYEAPQIETRILLPESLRAKYVAPPTREANLLDIMSGKQSFIPMPSTRSMPQIRWTPSPQTTPIRNHAGEVLVTTKAGVTKMVRKKEGGEIPMFQDGSVIPGTPISVNWAGLLDLGTAVAQNVAISKSYDIQKDALSELKKRQFQAPILAHQRIDTSAIEQKYNAATEPYKQMRFNYADPTMTMAGQLTKAAALSQLEAQKGTELTNYISQFNAQDVDTTNKQRQIDADMANQKSQYYTGLNYQDKMLDTQELNEKWANIWSPYLGQVRQQVRDNQNQLSQLDSNLKIQDLNIQRTKDQEYLLNQKFGQAYNADTSANKGTLMEWLAADPHRYAEYQEFLKSDPWVNLNNKYYKDVAKIQKNTISWFKKGGTMRSTQEQMAIDSNKEAKRAVQKMNDNLMKMLLQLVK